MQNVRATKTGYYDDKRRREGEVFQLNDEKDFSEKWMEYEDSSKQPSNAKAQDAALAAGGKGKNVQKSKSDGEAVTPKGTRPVPGQDVI